ncbi:hypothetical protein CIG75_05245 [Tumebacillus algifaecis]|uniref:Uncharacterized protein n=1 Tax=Tumebacillus algifaecis TaxID=1214604 RepID=A0A223CYP4_9BACL|nr:hypothetical protein CIG75_05245 [Tumebacillus algifaecis]
MKIKVWMSITFASLLLLSGGLLAGGAWDVTSGGHDQASAVSAELMNKGDSMERPEPMGAPKTEPPEPMRVPVLAQTEPPEPMAPDIIG